MPKQIHNAKSKKLCINDDIAKINGAITKRGVSDKQLAAFFYETYYDFAKCHDTLGRTALHLAASCGRTELCQWLINVTSANTNAKDWESGYTPLQRALFHGHIQTAVRLMQMGADTSVMDKEGLTAIDLVIKDRPKQIEICPEVPCQVYIWGSNDNYTLGTGTNKSRKVPDILDNFKRRNVSIKQVCMDEFHSVFVSSCSRLWICGTGQGGRLGIPAERHVLTPRILGIGGEQCLMAALALNHTLVLLSNGTVLACGQNDYHQLGVSPYVKECLSLKPVSIKQNHEQITGICAGKYHSVLYGKTTIFTCGLNGGQLGHLQCENSPFIKIPSQVPINLKSGSYITHVASSSTCIVFSLSTGEIFMLYQFQFKKIASKQLDVQQIATAGGVLQTKIVNENNGVLKVVLLSTGGTIQIWQESVPHLIRCMFGLSRLISVSYIFLNERHVLFTTKDGEAFRGTIGQIEKQKVNSSQEDKSGFHKFVEKSQCYHVSTNRIPNIHRAVSITSDPKGKNLAVIQAHPHNSLTDVPVQNKESVSEQFLQLLNETSDSDNVHDIIFKVQKTMFPAHEYIIASNCSTFLTLPRQGKVIEINDIKAVIFKEILSYMYSGWCSIFNEGPVSLSLSNKKEEDPVRLLIDACNKYKISSMYKKIVCYRFENGSVKLKDGSIRPESEPPQFKRDSFPDLFDVEVSSEDGKHFKAHKCILAARLDYFHNMLMGGWLEAVTTPVLHLECPSKTLEVLLDFLYTNEIPDSVHSDGFESLGRLLVISDQILCNDLKDYCEVFLVNALNLKNAATMLQLSFLYNTTQLKRTVMQFISLNLESILESRCLEELSDDILLELDKYHRQFNATTFDKRIITPFMDHTIPDEIILSCSSLEWPEHVDDTSTKEIKSVKTQHKNVQPVTKKRPTPKKSQTVEQLVSKEPEIRVEREIEFVQMASSPPENDVVCFNNFDFPTLDSQESLPVPNIKVQMKISPEVRRVLPPKISQKQRKRLSLESEEVKEKIVEPTVPKPRFKGWAIISPPNCNDSNESNEQSTSPKVSNFVEIIASEQEERNNLFKLKTKPFSFTQMEDKAMEELYEFYNASNIFDERITVQRVVSSVVAKPTWIKTNKKLFH